MTPPPLRNPFSIATMVLGAVFAIHTTAYALWLAGVFRQAEDAGHALVAWLHHSGQWWLLVELAVLAVAVILAIATEDRWKGPSGR